MLTTLQGMTTVLHPEPLVAAAAADGLTLDVVDKAALSETVCALTLAEPDGRRLPDWSPGAHIDLVLPGNLVRQYSLCGDRWDPFHYRIAVLREPDGRGGSRYVHDSLTVGDRLPIGGPRNNFELAPAERYAFVAGGIGITPIVPMLRAADRLGTPWTLLYCGRTVESMAFARELRDDARVTVWPTAERGRPDVAALCATAGTGTRVYGCGPASMTADLVEAGGALPEGSVRVERFTAGTLAAPVRHRAFEVELRQTGSTITVSPGESVLEALGAAGVPMLSSCRQGTCGTCEATVLDGIPDHRDSLLTDDERRRNDCMFVCVSRSCSDRLILDL